MKHEAGTLAFLAFFLQNFIEAKDKGIFPTQQNTLSSIYLWKTLDYNWPNNETKENALKNGLFVPANNFPKNIRIWREKMFVTIPRRRTGVPVTLASFTMLKEFSPILEAFPDWEMQEIGNCAVFQHVTSVEIDPQGLMWIIDSGHIDTLEDSPPKSPCNPKLIIMDLNYDTYPIVKLHEFPVNVTSHDRNYLNDIVIDNTNGGFAYITDGGKNPGIIVYSFQQNQSWKFRDPSSMDGDDTLNPALINNRSIDIKGGNINGIALAPNTGFERYLYFAPFLSFNLYAVPSSALRDPQKARMPVKVGKKKGFSEGMVMDNRGNIFYGSMQTNEAYMWNTRSGRKEKQVAFATNEPLRWPSSFCISENGFIFVLCNKDEELLLNVIDPDVVNFKIFSSQIGSKSYLYPPPLTWWIPYTKK